MASCRLVLSSPSDELQAKRCRQFNVHPPVGPDDPAVSRSLEITKYITAEWPEWSSMFAGRWTPFMLPGDRMTA